MKNKELKTQYISLFYDEMPVRPVFYFFEDAETSRHLKQKYKTYAIFYPDKNRDLPDTGLVESCFKTVSHDFKIAWLFSNSESLFHSLTAIKDINIPNEQGYYRRTADEVRVDFDSAHKEWSTEQKYYHLRRIWAGFPVWRLTFTEFQFWFYNSKRWRYHGS